jgi:hypothetical protein
MKTIDTSIKDWQKQMDACMKSGETFTLLTSDPRLADALEKGKYNVGLIKLILFGSGAAGAGATSAATASMAIVGVSGAAKIAAGTAIFSLADPEPVSKIILAVIALIAFTLGCYFVYRLVKMLVKSKYKFTIDKKDSFGNTFNINASPA